MKLLVTYDGHIYRTPDGQHWSKEGVGYAFWSRYLKVFEKVRVAVRIKEVNNIDKNKFICEDCTNLEFYPIPFFRGPKELIRNFWSIRKAAKAAPIGCNAVIFRLPSTVGQMIYKYCKRKSLPVAVELVANVLEISESAKRNISSYVLLQIMGRYTKIICSRANGVAYVTKDNLQKVYPSSAHYQKSSLKYFTSHYSSIYLSEDYIGNPKELKNINEYKIKHMANAIEGDAKGHKVLIDALKLIREKGLNVSVDFIGTGSSVPTFEAYAKSIGIEQYVKFVGYISPSSAVRDALIQADIFVFPSVSEGLPRSVIQAMAVGLPCVSSQVGGIPELLDKEYLFDPMDVVGFAYKTYELLTDADGYARASKKNIQIAKEYTDKIISERRTAFYNKLKELVRI